MALIQPRIFPLRTGEQVVVRSATPGDAPALDRLLRGAFEEREFLITEPDEFQGDLAQRQAEIAGVLTDPNAARLCAWVGDALAGELSAQSGRRRRHAHRLRLAMVVAQSWRGRGVGRALLTTILDWAAAHPAVEKVSLGVFAHNERAIRLYRAMGFEEEGRRVREFRLSPCRYADEILMARFVKAPPDVAAS